VDRRQQKKKTAGCCYTLLRLPQPSSAVAPRDGAGAAAAAAPVPTLGALPPELQSLNCGAALHAAAAAAAADAREDEAGASGGGGSDDDHPAAAVTVDGAVWPRGPVINKDFWRPVTAVGGTCHAVRAALCAAVTAVAVTVAPATRPPAAASAAAGDGRPPRLVDVARFLPTLPTLRSLYVAVGGWSGGGADVVAVSGMGGLVADALAAVPAGRLTAFGWADAALTASELRLLRCHPLAALHVGPVVHDTARPPPTPSDTAGDGNARASPPFSFGPPPVTTVALDGDGSGGGYPPPPPPSADVDVARPPLADPYRNRTAFKPHSSIQAPRHWADVRTAFKPHSGRL